jgi:NADPH:quinone reductase-like Zn-dependent oxidoreductase
VAVDVEEKTMPRAVRFDRYGGIDVLRVVEVERPVPGPSQVLVRIKAAGINPGEAMIREGVLADRFPATFPSGEGSDLAGVVEEVGGAVNKVAVGDEVIGFTDNRASHAELVVVEADHVVARPAHVPWEQAGALFVAGTTAYATVRAVSLTAGDTVVISGAAGGVGSIAVQLARNVGARVLGLASGANHAWLTDHGVIPIAYGDGVAERIRAAAGGRVDAFIDTFGGGYVELALELGVKPDRIDTIIDFAAAAKHGVKTEGNGAAANAGVLAELAGLIDAGRLAIPIAKVYPLADVREAYQDLARRHTRGKIVLVP